jgi:hypothetical protein
VGDPAFPSPRNLQVINFNEIYLEIRIGAAMDRPQDISPAARRRASIMAAGLERSMTNQITARQNTGIPMTQGKKARPQIEGSALPEGQRRDADDERGEALSRLNRNDLGT